MPDNEVRILFIGDASKAIPEIEKILNGMKSLQEPPETLSKVTKTHAEEQASLLGMTRREWMRTGTEATFYLTSIAGKSGETGQAIANAAGMVTQLGESFAFGGAAGAALAIVGIGISALVAQNPQVQALNAELDKLAKHDDAVVMLAKLAGVEETQAQKALAAAKENQAYASALRDLVKEAEAPIGAFEMLGDAVNQFTQFMQSGLVAGQQLGSMLIGLGGGIASFYGNLKDGKSYEEAAAAGAQSMRDIMLGTTEQIQKRQEAQTRLNAKVIDAGIVEDRLTRATREQNNATGEMAASAQKYAQALDQVATAQNNMLKSMVEKALTPTTVTDEDITKTKSGTYTNKWDEFRRRIEAVTKGTNPAQFGAEFEAALAKLNMPLDVAAEKFKNFSLFADPKNLKLVDWNAMTADIGNQLLQLVGKANVMKEGFSKAWASLSADQRRSLRELGIESAGDAKKVLMGAADSGVDGLASQFGDKENQKKLKGAGDQLVKTVQTGMLDKETMKTWTGGVDSLVAKIQEQFAVKENVKLLADAGTSIVQAISEGVSKSTALAEALMGAVDKAIQEAIAYIKQNYGDTSGGGTGAGSAVPVPAVPGFAGGGMGVFAKGGLVHVDTGEGYMFTGRGGGLPSMGGNVSIVYAPQVSLASQAEVTSVLEPMVNRAMRQVQARRAA